MAFSVSIRVNMVTAFIFAFSVTIRAYMLIAVPIVILVYILIIHGNGSHRWELVWYEARKQGPVSRCPLFCTIRIYPCAVQRNLASFNKGE